MENESTWLEWKSMRGLFKPPMHTATTSFCRRSGKGELPVSLLFLVFDSLRVCRFELGCGLSGFEHDA